MRILTTIGLIGSRRLCLGWVTARYHQGLVAFVNVIWDGRVNAFIEDTLVAHRARRKGASLAGRGVIQPPLPADRHIQ